MPSNVERLVLAQKQLAEELPEKPSTVLLTDETSKFGKKYMGDYIGDSDGNTWETTLGIQMETLGRLRWGFRWKYLGDHVGDSDGNTWVLGLREMETKSASDTLETFKVILQDIDNHASVASQQADGDITSIPAASLRILFHTEATMSD